MNQLRLGYVFGIGAHTLWGFFPAYFKLLRPSSPVEVLAHRIGWSCLFMVMLLTVMRQWRRIGGLLRQPRKVAAITAAAVLIGLNWGTYIWAVNADRVVETALGYFITPLVSIILGMVFLSERLRSWQWVAVGIGTIAVLVLTVDYGRLPWVAFVLAVSFGFYGLVKKQLGLPAADGLFVESAVLAVPAVATLFLLPNPTFGGLGTGHTLLIAASGAITAMPLLMFAGAANRIPLISLGMLQYIGPTIQLFLGVFAFHEPMPPVRLAGFVLVWIALAVFSWDGLRRRAAVARLT
ncbi:EamA family transporter RarD [Allorhizocola rhizosphaerae]|uniref:EamA family transporter RarD n=1 Tax=Allorhizocola rhizosphaerae TaxID=1872709 RepID=UPI000E3CA9B4|nr:EamA family transporter RarD [Allorhizocola rhizosphaerae]